LGDAQDSSEILALQKRIEQIRLGQSLERTYSPSQVLGYEIDHDFRSRNSTGGMELHRWRFILDKNFKVLYVFDRNDFVDSKQLQLERYMKFFYRATLFDHD
jgi:hypothetical protein